MKVTTLLTSASSTLPRLPEFLGVITVDLTMVYPRPKREECEVRVYRVPTERELYGETKREKRS